MASKSVRELALALPDGERRALLAKIQKSLQIDEDTQTTIYHSKGDTEARKAAVRAEWQRMSIWSRIVLFFRKLFSTKTEDELIQAMSLDRIQRRLHARGDELIRIEGRYLLPGFAELVYRLYLSLLPLINIFRKFWKNTELLQGLVEFVLDRKIPQAKSSIFRFITFNELQQLFEKHENKDAIKRELVRQIDVYIENIPPEVFREIEDGIFPLYYYKELILFNFEEFFTKFQVDILQVSEGGDVNFKPAKADPLMSELEHLYYAVYTARRAQAVSSLHDEVFVYFSSMTDRPRPESATMLGSIHDPGLEPPHDDLAEISEDEVGDLPEKYQELSLLGTEQRKIFKEIAGSVENFWRLSSLGNIIRFFRGDPFYRFIAYAPRLNVKEFYQSALRLKVLEELDEQYANVRREVINHKKDQIFPRGMQGFEFYTRSVLSSSNVKLPVFRYVDSLTSLYQFLIYRFERDFLETFRVLARILPERYRDHGSRLILSIANIEELLDHIRSFDYSFSPLSDDGKSFYRLRFAAEKDITQLKAYRVVVAQKDREVRELITRGGESFKNLERILSPLLEAPLQNINDRFQSLIGTGTGSLQQRLERAMNDLGAVQKIMFYEQQLEDELVI
jgi:hypothetical protein